MPQTATNPQTGERVVLQNGQWVPLEAAPQAPTPAIEAQPGNRQASGAQPRGIRNNNPGNIEDGPFARSLPGYAGSDGRFARFETPEAGNQAAPRLLASYVQRGFNTPNSIINRWAPPSDNNPTQAYASYVAQRLGIGPDDVVSEAQIPLLAQAISEFENGQRVGGAGASPVQTATNPQTGERMRLVNGQWTPEAQQTSAPAQETFDGIFDFASMAPEEQMQLQRGDKVRLPNGEVVTLRGQPFVSETREGDRQVGGLNLREPNAQDQVGAFASGMSEQIPFLDEAQVAADAALSGRSFSDARDEYQDMQTILNQTNRSDRNAGGIAGFAAGLAAPGGSYIAQGANRLQQVARAAQVAAPLGFVYAAGAGEGNAQERAARGVQGAAISAGTAGVAQRLLGANPSAVVSPARELSREGVRLTPGQMMGGVANTLEEIGTSIPVLREAVQGARRRGFEDFNRSAANRVLAPLGERVDRNVEAGRTLVAQVRDRVSQRYRDALDNVQIGPDATFRNDFATRLSGANLTPDATRELNGLLNNTILPRFNQAIDGQTFKALDEELGAAARSARNAGGPNARYFAEVVEGIQDDLDALLARVNPKAAEGKQAADEAYANLVRLEEAAGSAEAARRGGVFTPSQLNSAVRRTETGSRNARYARGDALMQDLSDNAMQVLPNTVPDSGTPLRGLMTGGLLSGGGVALGVEPATAAAAVAGVGTAAAAYSRPAQAIANAFYRATDPAGKLQALGQARAAAAQNPALVPLYQDLLAAWQGQSPSPAQPTAPRGQAQPIPIGP